MKKLLIVVLSLILVFSLASCNSNNTPKEVLDVKIVGLKGPTSIGMIKSIDEIPSLGDNVTSSYEIVPAPDVLIAKLLNDEFDFATVPTNVAAILFNKKDNYQIMGIPIWGMLYVVTNDVEINSWEDFKGQNVYPFAQGSSPDIIFQHLANANGLTPFEDVDISYNYQQAELAQALIAGEVSVAVLPEPFVTSALLKNPDLKIVMDIQEEWKKANMASSVVPADSSYPMTSLIVRKQFAIDHPEIVASFEKSYADSIIWVNENPKEASLLVEKHEIGFAAKAAELAIPRANMDYKSISEVKNEVSYYFDVLSGFSMKTIGGAMPDETIYYEK